MKEDKVVIAGFGGQGVLLLGDLIADSAIREGCYATWVPSYGPESRGGTCNCQVVYSEKQIGSPAIENPNVIIAFTKQSIEKFVEKKDLENTLLIYDSYLVKEAPQKKGIKAIGIPATEMSKMANMVMLGAYLQISKKISLETVIKKSMPAMLTESKAKFISANIEAIKQGMDYIRKNYPEFS